MEKYNLKHYAHLGDAVYDVFIRRHIIDFANNQKELHNLTTKYVNATFQYNLLNMLFDDLTEEEKELVRRGRNLPLTIAKRHNPKVHTSATAFEVLIGYLYINDKKRLEDIFEIISKKAL